MCVYIYIYIYCYTSSVRQAVPPDREPDAPAKGPPEYCQDGTVMHLNYNRLL